VVSVVARMSVADAARAGLLDQPARKPRTTRKAVPRDGAVSRCQCGEVFDTDAAETRHVRSPGHNRFESVL
jgi:hypothetical protein